MENDKREQVSDMERVVNLFSGEEYKLESEEKIKYLGFSPASGHFIVREAGKETSIPHNTKFYKSK